MKRKKQILIVEDELVLQRALNLTFCEDYEVVTTKDGQAAVDYLKKNMVDLIMLDLFIAGMSGLDVIKALRKAKRTKSIPVIILTNASDTDMRKKCSKLGIKHYFLKSELILSDFKRVIVKLLK